MEGFREVEVKGGAKVAGKEVGVEGPKSQSPGQSPVSDERGTGTQAKPTLPRLIRYLTLRRSVVYLDQWYVPASDPHDPHAGPSMIIIPSFCCGSVPCSTADRIPNRYDRPAA